MQLPIKLTLLTLLSALILLFYFTTEAFAWRSALYPINWVPGYKDPQDLTSFLHDFSYAGYHAGEKEIPTGNFRAIYNVTQAPYNAVADGTTDATLAIQAAIDAAENAGGGIIYLPEGTYLLTFQESNPWALRIDKSNVVIRGAGAGVTKLFLDETVTRDKSMIYVGLTTDTWNVTSGTSMLIGQDLLEPTKVIPFSNTPSFAVGEWVVIRHDVTEEWNAEHGMTMAWADGADPVYYYRQIKEVDTAAKTITLDTPTRYYLKTRDRARVHKVAPHIEEIGIENLSVGMRENTNFFPTANGKNMVGLLESDYSDDVNQRAGYQIHNSNVIFFRHVVNGWIQNVTSYLPPTNTKPVIQGGNYFNFPPHIHANAIEINQSRFITIANCNFQNIEYTGGGGNGHFYGIYGNDILVRDSVGINGRHNFQISRGYGNGNVLYNNTSGKGWHMDDFHTKLAQANLIDNHTVDGNAIESRNRYRHGNPGQRHGVTNTQSVFWNTNGKALYSRKNLDDQSVDYIIHSDQQGRGYVIGTRGNYTNVYTPLDLPEARPIDFVEGIGQGATLIPQSLYLDQLQKRVGLNSPTPTPTPIPTPIATDVTKEIAVLGNHQEYISSPDTLHIVGEVKNNTGAKAEFVKITVNLFNAQNQLVDTDFTYLYLNPLAAGDIACFHVIFLDAPAYHHYTFETSYSASTDPIFPIAWFGFSGSYNGATDGGYDVVGQTRNDGNVNVESVQAIGTLFQRNGQVLDCTLTYTSADVLTPGQVSTWKITFSNAPNGEVANYKLQVQGRQE